MTSTTKPQDNSPAKQPPDLRGLVPALHLLRASGLAIDPRKMFLGGLALVLLFVGDILFGLLPFAQEPSAVHVATKAQSTVADRLFGCCGFLPRPEIRDWLSWEATAYSLLTPVRTLIEPARVIFEVNVSWSELAFAWTQLFWALVVWSLIGGALSRMNALQFAKRKRLSVGAALRFSRRQLLNYLVAPFLPLSAVLILQGFNWLLGLLASLVPSVGFVAIGIGWIVVLFSGFLMAALVLGIACGWPLMIAAISTEDSDGFDGLSRAFGYLFDRPWQAGLFVVSSLPVFAVSRILIGILIGLTISLGTTAVLRGKNFPNSSYNSLIDLTSNDQTIPRFISHTDWLIATLTQDWNFSSLQGMADFAVDGWMLIPALLYVGFGPSFFWSATTVSYFLLRQSDDGTPLDSVVDWPEKSEPEMPAVPDTGSGESVSEGQS
jgi:hypothetical protein